MLWDQNIYLPKAEHLDEAGHLSGRVFKHPKCKYLKGWNICSRYKETATIKTACCKLRTVSKLQYHGSKTQHGWTWVRNPLSGWGFDNCTFSSCHLLFLFPSSSSPISMVECKIINRNWLQILHAKMLMIISSINFYSTTAWISGKCPLKH